MTKSEKNSRRSARRRLLRLTVRREYVRDTIIDGRADEIEGWILAIRANNGHLPPGLIEDTVLAAQVERAAVFPFRQLPRHKNASESLARGSARSMSFRLK